MRQLNKRNFPTYVRNHTLFLNRIVDLRRKKAIDIGCGDGIFLNQLKKQLGLAQIVGLDIDPKRCKLARKLNPGTKIIEGDAQKIPFKTSSFDFVFVNALLHHVKNPYSVINELVRICRDGGWVAMVEPRTFHPAIFFLSLLKTEERGQLRFSLKKICQFLKKKKTIKEIQTFPVNSFLYPYQQFPPRFLFNIVSKLEDIFNHPSLSTHQAVVVRVKK